MKLFSNNICIYIAADRFYKIQMGKIQEQSLLLHWYSTTNSYHYNPIIKAIHILRSNNASSDRKPDLPKTFLFLIKVMAFSQVFFWLSVTALTVFISLSDASCKPGLSPLTVSHRRSYSSSGTVAAKSQFSFSYPAWKAFSDVPRNQRWISRVSDSPTWISYTFNADTTISCYTLYFNNGPTLTSRAPKHFQLQVRQGSGWQAVDTRYSETNWLRAEERAYTIPAVTGREFRIEFFDDNDGRPGPKIVVISLTRIQFLGVKQ